MIAALKEKGLYKNDLGSGKHDVTCPWVKDHTDSLDNGAAYFEPSSKYPTGGFRCHHSHGNLFHLRHLRVFLGISPVQVDAAQVVHAQQLPPALRPVPPLDPIHLPFAIRDAVADVANRLNCPPDYLVVAMLSAAGSVIGNKIGIFPYANDESWHVFPALWGGIVGDPGSKKTPSLQQAHAPLQHLENQAAQKYAQDMINFEQAKAQHELATKASKTTKGSMLTPPPPPEPKRERFVVHDTTYQALGVILADNPRGVLALADELSGLLQSLDTAGQEAARGFYLSGWSGTGSYSFDRIGRGSITLPRYCLSVFGGFQPDRIKAYVQFAQRGNSKNDGLLQRFQMAVWPDSEKFEYVDRPPKRTERDAVAALFKLADTFDPMSIGTADNFGKNPPSIGFDACAQGLFIEWYTDFMTTRRAREAAGEDSLALSAHFGKYPGLLGKLSLSIHIADCPTKTEISERTITKALAWLDYLAPHARRIYHGANSPDADAARLLLARIQAGKVQSPFKARDVYRNGWHGLGNAEHVKSACSVLVDYGYLREVQGPASAGRPSDPVYQINTRICVDA